MVNQILAGRRSVRAFSREKVDNSILDGLFEAARWAPSNGNRQPWRFIVFSGQDRGTLAPALSRGNQWALEATVLVVVAARPADGGSSNGINYSVYDCALAVMCLIIEAEHRGLRVHQMAGWSKEVLAEAAGLPEDAEPVVVIALGYEGRVEDLPPPLQEKENRPRTRRSLDEIRAFGRWKVDWNTPPEAKR